MAAMRAALRAALEKADAESDALAVGGIVEAARTTEKSSAVGNAAAMREALIQCELFLGNVERHGHPTLNPGDKCIACDGVEELRNKVNSALSAPPRNCDVGTAEEQAERMRQFCAKQKRNGIINCGYCPIKHQYQRDCTLAWAQVPCAEEGASDAI